MTWSSGASPRNTWPTSNSAASPWRLPPGKKPTKERTLKESIDTPEGEIKTAPYHVTLPQKYDGKTHPSEFLSIYTIAVQAAGGRDDKILANYFPLVLKPNVRS